MLVIKCLEKKKTNDTFWLSDKSDQAPLSDPDKNKTVTFVFLRDEISITQFFKTRSAPPTLSVGSTNKKLAVLNYDLIRLRPKLLVNFITCKTLIWCINPLLCDCRPNGDRYLR